MAYVTDTALAAGSGASLVGFERSETGATLLTVADVLAGNAVTPEQFGATGGSDDTAAVQAALDTGKPVYFGAEYICTEIDVTTAGQRLSGPGKLIKKSGVDSRLLYVTAPRVQIVGLSFDGTAAAPNPGPSNDLIRFQGADDGLVEAITLIGSQGTGVRFDSSARCRLLGSIVRDCQLSNVLVCNPGADDCIIAHNQLSGSVAQNNIYLTANDGGAAGPEAFLYRTIVLGNQCSGALDTGIESGAHTVGTIIEGNMLAPSRNPAILLRDCLDVNVGRNFIRTPDIEAQNQTYSAIAVLPLAEPATWDYRSIIGPNIVRGAVNVAALYIDGCGVTVDGLDAFDDVTDPGEAFAGLSGRGVTLGGNVSRITIRNAQLRRFEIGIDLNLDGQARTLGDIDLHDNLIRETKNAINAYNCTFSRSVIRGNRITDVTVTALKLDSADYLTGLRFVDNLIELGAIGGTPTRFSPVGTEIFGLQTSLDSKVLPVPEVQYDNVVVAAADTCGWGICTLRFLDGSAAAVFAAGGRSGVGTVTTAKLLGTANLLDSSGAAGFADWALFYDPSNNLVLQRRGTTTSAGPRQLEVTLSAG